MNLISPNNKKHAYVLLLGSLGFDYASSALNDTWV
jgi:hypothetical protein